MEIDMDIDTVGLEHWQGGVQTAQSTLPVCYTSREVIGGKVVRGPGDVPPNEASIAEATGKQWEQFPPTTTKIAEKTSITSTTSCFRRYMEVVVPNFDPSTLNKRRSIDNGFAILSAPWKSHAPQQQQQHGPPAQGEGSALGSNRRCRKD